MTKQETFDFVYNKLVEQGEPCIGGDNYSCLYRNGKNQKCAGGHLIPDHLYEDAMENTSWDELHEKYPEIAALGHDCLLVQDLQEAHDAWGEPHETDLDSNMIPVAIKHGLKFTPYVLLS